MFLWQNKLREGTWKLKLIVWFAWKLTGISRDDGKYILCGRTAGCKGDGILHYFTWKVTDYITDYLTVNITGSDLVYSEKYIIGTVNLLSSLTRYARCYHEKNSNQMYIYYRISYLSCKVVVDTISFRCICIHTLLTEKPEYKEFMWLSPDSQVN